jgi:hypothetical protein
MKKIAWTLSAILLLVFAPQVQAWEWSTHRQIVQVVYDELPDNVKVNLDWSLIYEGSTWPDLYRHNPDPRYGLTYPSHFQPEARDQAEHWLEKAQTYYQDGDFDDASLALGIAAHYIADASCLAHNPPYAYDWDLHGEFEYWGTQISPDRPWGIPNFDLRQALTQIEMGAPDKWQRWLQTRDLSIVQEDLNNATMYTYNAWCQALDVTPRSPPPQESIWPVDPRIIAGTIFAILVVSMVIGRRRYYRM